MELHSASLRREHITVAKLKRVYNSGDQGKSDIEALVLAHSERTCHLMDELERQGCRVNAFAAWGVHFHLDPFFGIDGLMKPFFDAVNAVRLFTPFPVYQGLGLRV
jgi:hypothetical protein